MDYLLDFERPINELENQIKELQGASVRPQIDISSEIGALQKKVAKLIEEIYTGLTPWERVQLSRHPHRPHALDAINAICSNFHELSGDRHFGDDAAIVVGAAEIEGQAVFVAGIEKGRNTKEKVLRNFGMPRPEGYRKARRMMELANQFSIPLITFVDTPGAYPGIGAEERGQSEAIASNLEKMFELEVPIISVVIGEGGSGGALGIAVADRVLMMEYSIYSVISPESCASILWADPKKAEEAANGLKLGPQMAHSLGVIDDIVKEPPGGAHRNPAAAMEILKQRLCHHLSELQKLSVDQLKKGRWEKFRRIGNKTLTVREGWEEQPWEEGERDLLPYWGYQAEVNSPQKQDGKSAQNLQSKS